MNYQANAWRFAKKHNIHISIDGYYWGEMWDDGRYRCIFRLTMSRFGQNYSFEFGQSIADGSKEPTMYDVLSCLTKYDPGDLADFCSDFGYEPTKQVRETYKAVCKEFRNVERLFGDIIEELQEIQ